MQNIIKSEHRCKNNFVERGTMNRHFKSTFLSVISYIIFVSFDQSFANLEHDFKEAITDTEESLGKHTI